MREKYYLSLLACFVFSLASNVLFAQTPVITGQNTFPSFDEDTSIEILIGWLDVDWDGADPNDFSLVVTPSGSNYTAAGNIVTPAQDYFGALLVEVVVTDGTITSASFDFSLTVDAVYDPPVITGQVNPTYNVNEDTQFTLSLSDLVIENIEGNPLTLVILSGTNYTFSGTTITPAANYFGSLTVNLRVNDGVDDSNDFGFQVTVNEVHDPPVITGQVNPGYNVNEDTQFTLSLSDLVIENIEGNPLTLVILSGTNYTFSGTTITPAANYFGSLTVNLRVNDGVANSNTFEFQVEVNAVYDPPVITGQVNPGYNVNEDTQFTLSMSDLVIENIEGNPLTLVILPGTNYTFSGTTITPAANYFGPLTVNLRVNDGVEDSNTFEFQVEVNAVHDPPVITGQVNPGYNVNEDTQFTLSLSDLVIENIEGNPLTLVILSGTNYTFSGTTITPAANYFGPLTVNLRVNDGVDDSNDFGFQVTVNEVHDPPVITGQVNPGYNVNEDTQFTLSLSDLVIENIEGNPLTLVILSGTNYTFSGTTITPAANYFGPLTVNLRVNDGVEDSNDFAFQLTVNAINDPPTINPISNVEVDKNSPTVSVPISGITAGPSESQTLTVTVSNNNNTLFASVVVNYESPNTTGTINITPNANVFGMATFTVTVTDSGPNTPPHDNTTSTTFTFTINNVNYTPTFDPISNVTINEDAPLQNVNITGISPGLGEAGTQTVTLSATSSNTTLIPNANISISYNGTDPTATLSFTPAANRWGVSTITVLARDSEDAEFSSTFTVTVNEINDAPTLDPISNVTVLEDSPTQNIPLNNITAGPFETQVLTVTATAGNMDLFDNFQVNYTSPNTLGILSITPKANAFGSTTVTVTVTDDGLSTPPHVNTISREFTFTITPVNDAPVITGQQAVSINTDESFTITLGHLTVTDPDNVYPDDFTLSVLSGANYTVSGNTITPVPGFSGNLSVGVFVNDGQANSNTFNFIISVDFVNIAPVITGQTPNPIQTNEDTPFDIEFSNLTVTDPDNSYPADFTLTILPGANYTVSGNTVTPAQDYFGNLSVGVRVNDGTVNSNTFNVQVQVLPVNDPPLITGQVGVINIDENQPFTILLSHITVTDVDNNFPADFTLQVQAGTNYTFSGNTITPALNFTGTISVNIRVSDGTDFSPTFIFQINVNFVNEAPTTSGFQPVTINEDHPDNVVINLHNVFDDREDGPDGLTYQIVTNSHPAYFETISINESDQLVFKVAANRFGVANITVRATDSQGLTVQSVLTVTINAVNDPPSFNAIENIIIPENSPPVVINVTGISPGPFETESVQLTAQSSDANIIPNLNITVNHNGTSATGTITLQPAENRTGVVTITVRVVDTGLLEFIRTFTVTVEDINDPPTLNPLSNLTIPEDSPVQEISLTGITAGPFENQVLTVTATTNNSDLFEIFQIVYQSPQTTGLLRIKSKPDAFGTASITVRVTDDGSNTPPHRNFVTRTFTLTVTPVNDPPVFVSDPVEIAIVGEVYQYLIEAIDVDPGDVMTITAVEKPAWLTLTSQGNGVSLLEGTPPAGSGGTFNIVLEVRDPSNATDTQEFLLRINTRPEVTNFTVTLNEDEPETLGAQRFNNAFTDADDDALERIQIVRLPSEGRLLLGGQQVTLNQQIDQVSLNNLIYSPNQDYFGRDTVEWRGSDGLSYSLASAKIFFDILPVNDPPVITVLESTLLEFNVGEEPILVSNDFVVIDVDNEFLQGAQIGFRNIGEVTYVADADVLIYNSPSTPAIQGSFAPESGILTLTGTATIAEYITAIRTIRYDFVTDLFFGESLMKSVYYTVTDGAAFSTARERQIKVIDTFEDLHIPNAFTPNSDVSNDTWSITNIDRHPDATVKVYNMMGLEVFSSDGNYDEWDGSYDGKLLPTDTYYYIIDLRLPVRKKVYRGAVTILR